MKQTDKKGLRNKTGALGEQVAVTYLKQLGFTIVEQNFLKKWGEIDIIAKRDTDIHFVEVKTVSYETKESLQRAVSHGTWRPEENVTPQKIHKLNRVIETWIEEQPQDLVVWQIDVVAVRIVPHEKYATIKYLPNIIL
jgi:putative endonuclease